MSALEDIIKDEIRAKGQVTFARFMELALYHPDHGYYGSARVKIGKEGDYYTNSHVSPLYGRLMAEAYMKLKDSLYVNRCPFIEMGAGEGYMAFDFIEELHRYHGHEVNACEYIIIERSHGMREIQKETLRHHAGHVKWYDSVEEMPGPVTGVFFSNELVDAMPFHRITQTDDALQEVYVNVKDGKLAEALGAISTVNIVKHLNRIGVRLPDGMTSEISLEAPEWIRSLAAKLEKGYVITVDYGYPAHEYYSPARRTGTFVCYHKHTVNESPYERIGEQDITAHADFTTLALAGKEAGLTPLMFTEQTNFLMAAAGEVQVLLTKAGAGQHELEEVGQGLKALLHPEWMGGTFKALIQAKDAGLPRMFDAARNRLPELWNNEGSWSKRIV